MKDGIKVTGKFVVKLFDKYGKLKDESPVQNVVTTAGKNYLAAWLAAASQADYFMKYMGIGTGTTAAQATDTTLETEVLTRATSTITSNTNVWIAQATFGPHTGSTLAITEAGVFSASTGGTMMSRQVFPVKNKEIGDTLQLTWQITIS